MEAATIRCRVKYEEEGDNQRDISLTMTKGGE